MKRRWLIGVAFLLLFSLGMPVQAFAMESVAVEIPFTVENLPGTVVMEALNGAPAPAQSEFANVSEGKFALSFNEPDDYVYRVYQEPGTEAGATYDDFEYTVIVSVSVNDDGSLYAMTTLVADGDNHKPESITFKNVPPKPTPTPTATPPVGTPQTGDDSNPVLWLTMLAASALSLGAVVIGRGKKRLG